MQGTHILHTSMTHFLNVQVIDDDVSAPGEVADEVAAALAAAELEEEA